MFRFDGVPLEFAAVFLFVGVPLGVVTLVEVEAGLSDDRGAVVAPLEDVEAAVAEPLGVVRREGEGNVMALVASCRLDGVVGADLSNRMKFINL